MPQNTKRACHYKRPIPRPRRRVLPQFRPQFACARLYRGLAHFARRRLRRSDDAQNASSSRRRKKRPGMRPAITWPEPTHYPRESLHLTGNGEVWRPAREIIDWSIPGHSIYLSPEEARKTQNSPSSGGKYRAAHLRGIGEVLRYSVRYRRGRAGGQRASPFGRGAARNTAHRKTIAGW